MKYAGFKLGTKVILFVPNKPELGESPGIVTYSSGQRLKVTDDQNRVWDFTRHGTCTNHPDVEMRK